MLSISQTILEAINDDTQNNYHNEAILRLAHAVKHKKAIETMKAIIKIHEIEGYMPEAIYQYTRQVYQNLMQYCENNMTPDDFKKLRSSI